MIQILAWRKYWKRLVVRRFVALVIFLGALALDYYLASIPLQLDLEAYPATAKLGKQELVIEEPVLSRPTDPLLKHEGRGNGIVYAYFDQAHLAGETLQLLNLAGVSPPASLGPISYLPQESETGSPGAKPCQTFVEVRLRPAERSVTGIHFFQVQKLPPDTYRTLELGATGAEFHVSIMTAAPDEGDRQGVGCQKLLVVDRWKQPLGPSVPIAVTVPALSSFRLTFESFEPFGPLSTLSHRNLFALQPFDAHCVQVRSLPDQQPHTHFLLRSGCEKAGPSSKEEPFAAPALTLYSPKGKPPLTVLNLGVGPDQLQVEALGRGWVRKYEEYETESFWDRLTNYPLLALLFGSVQLALLNWLKTLFVQRGRTQSETGQPS